MTRLPVPDLGGYLREQRQAAKLSLRQAAQAAGISNPYLSQIERGLKKPSAEILQQLATGLRISAEQLYVRAGILEDRVDGTAEHRPDVPAAVLADTRLSDRQRRVLLDVYESFVGENEPTAAAGATEPTPPSTAAASAAAPLTSAPSSSTASTPTEGG